MTRWKLAFDRIQNILEWALIALMLFAVVWLIVNIPLTPPAGASGPLASLFGLKVASILYACAWAIESVLLAYAKIFKKARLRAWTLFAIFLTHVFVIGLAISLRGIGWHLIDNIAIAALSAWLWLRAKLQYEYVSWEDLEHFDE